MKIDEFKAFVLLTRMQGLTMKMINLNILSKKDPDEYRSVAEEFEKKFSELIDHLEKIEIED